MERKQSGIAASVFVVLMLVSSSLIAAADDPVERTHDGLELMPDTKVMAVWVKPGADFSGYHRVMILEAQVAFRKNWLRDQNRSSINRISNRDVQRIKDEMAKLLHEVFVEALSSKGGLKVVDAADTDVLLVRPAIIDLDVTAPEPDGTGRSRSFASSAGAATLFLELFDSVTGEVLARAVDRQSANQPGDIMRMTSSVTNRNAAKRILTGWADLLRQSLDELRAPGAGG